MSGVVLQWAVLEGQCYGEAGSAIHSAIATQNGNNVAPRPRCGPVPYVVARMQMSICEGLSRAPNPAIKAMRSAFRRVAGSKPRSILFSRSLQNSCCSNCSSGTSVSGIRTETQTKYPQTRPRCAKARLRSFRAARGASGSTWSRRRTTLLVP